MNKHEINKHEIIKFLKSEAEYLKEMKELHNELGISLFTGTLIKGEAEDLLLKIYEKIAIVEFINGAENE